MEIVILGTASAIPTEDRNHPAMLLKFEGHNMLFDCGEGTQRQLRIAKESPMKIQNIFISHWHGDHVLGLPGLLQSYGMNNRRDSVHIWGPVGSKKRLEHLMEGFSVRVPCTIVVHELNPTTAKKIYDDEKFEIWALKLVHPTACLGYYFKEKDTLRLHKDKVLKLKLQGYPILDKLKAGKDVTYEGKKLTVKTMTYTQPGKKVTIILDTAASDKIANFAKGSDLFVCEATFLHKEAGKAKERDHMTAKQAARMAKKAQVKKLVLTHYSQRYKSLKDLHKEASAIFKNVEMAKDFSRFKL